jgi:hypothetical protein
MGADFSLNKSCSITSVIEQLPLKNGKTRGILRDLFSNQPGY